MKRILTAVAVTVLIITSAAEASMTPRAVSESVAADMLGPLTAKTLEAKVYTRAYRCTKVGPARWRCPVTVRSDAMRCHAVMVNRLVDGNWWTWGRKIHCSPIA